MLLFLLVSLLISIPQTSIQDVSISIENHQKHLAKRSPIINQIDTIENLLQWLTEQQYQYETAYYALALNNVFPNFAKFFHERGEQKYNDMKNLIRLCQLLNLNVNLQYISSSLVSRPLRFLSPQSMNKTNFAQFLSNLQQNECETTFERILHTYDSISNVSIPLRMYFEKKFYPKQVLTCKLTSDLFTQLDRFIDTKSNDRSIPFSFMFLDARAQLYL